MTDMNALKASIKINARIHITLIGMNECGYRINGGCGFAVTEPSLKLSFTSSKSFAISDNRKVSLSVDEINRLHHIIAIEKDLHNFKNNINIGIQGDMLSHYGFGSGTAIRLACLEALFIANQTISKQEQLILASGRGGTSGIGINSYFKGGFIVDLGKKDNKTKHAPSHKSEDRAYLPLLMQQIEMPEWDVGICIPSSIPNKTESEETAFFDKTCPIQSKDVYETLYHSIFGIYSAVREHDKFIFCQAIKEIQQCTWKLAERSEYGSRLTNLEKLLYSCGAQAVGMSSLGPSLFFLADNIASVIEKMRGTKTDCQFILSKASNDGRQIIHE